MSKVKDLTLKDIRTMNMVKAQIHKGCKEDTVEEMDILAIVMEIEVLSLAMEVQMVTLSRIGLEIPILRLLCHQSVGYA